MTYKHADKAFRKSVRTLIPASGATRLETDSLGSRPIPADVYWGINVSRALDNFPISGSPISIYPDLIIGYACLKQAAARANAEIGVLDAKRAELIDRACEEIKEGKLHEQFVVDVMQGGAGTSTNMNANEVISNRAIEITGGDRFAEKKADPSQRPCQQGPVDQRHVSDGHSRCGSPGDCEGTRAGAGALPRCPGEKSR